ncbi:MAG: tryptophan-rich sensory protein [Methylophilaceae bacterium]|nr:tryptophan-rich sensory protein [Methylophilaceae bacterium]
MRRHWITLLPFLLIVGAVAAAGATFQPGAWYEQLAKPFWTPPDWLFAPVWTVLYGMIAVAGWLLFSGTDSTLKRLWGAQLVLNGLWSWLFLGLHQPLLGLIDIMLLAACIAALVVRARRICRPVMWLMVPYLAWVSYATTLNAAIWAINPA